MNSLPKDEIIAYKLMDSFAKNVQCEGLRSRGSGLQEDKTNHKIGVLFIDFESNQILDIESARKIAVHYVNDFLGYINRNISIRSYLTLYPATSITFH